MMAANITGGRLGRLKGRDPPHLRDFVTRVYLVRGDKKKCLKLLERLGGFSHTDIWDIWLRAAQRSDISILMRLFSAEQGREGW